MSRGYESTSYTDDVGYWWMWLTDVLYYSAAAAAAADVHVAVIADWYRKLSHLMPHCLHASAFDYGQAPPAFQPACQL